MSTVVKTEELPELPDHISSNCRDFIYCCLNRDPTKRLNVCKLLNHPFIKETENYTRFNTNIDIEENTMTEGREEPLNIGENKGKDIKELVSKYRCLDKEIESPDGTQIHIETPIVVNETADNDEFDERMELDSEKRKKTNNSKGRLNTKNSSNHSDMNNQTGLELNTPASFQTTKKSDSLKRKIEGTESPTKIKRKTSKPSEGSFKVKFKSGNMQTNIKLQITNRMIPKTNRSILKNIEMKNDDIEVYDDDDFDCDQEKEQPVELHHINMNLRISKAPISRFNTKKVSKISTSPTKSDFRSVQKVSGREKFFMPPLDTNLGDKKKYPRFGSTTAEGGFSIVPFLQKEQQDVMSFKDTARTHK